MENVEYPFDYEANMKKLTLMMEEIEDPQQKLTAMLFMSVSQLQHEVSQLRIELYQTKLEVQELGYMNHRLARTQSRALEQYIEDYREMDQENRGRNQI